MVIRGRAVLTVIMLACLLLCLPGPHAAMAGSAMSITQSDHHHDQCDAPVAPSAPGQSTAELTLDGLLRGWLPTAPATPVRTPLWTPWPAVPTPADPLLLLCTSRR